MVPISSPWVPRNYIEKLALRAVRLKSNSCRTRLRECSSELGSSPLLGTKKTGPLKRAFFLARTGPPPWRQYHFSCSLESLLNSSIQPSVPFLTLWLEYARRQDAAIATTAPIADNSNGGLPGVFACTV